MRTAKNEYYKKVFINSKDDLPKHPGSYDVIYKDGRSGKLFYDDGKDGKSLYLQFIDWYLLPIVLPSQELIEKQTELINHFCNNIPDMTRIFNCKDYQIMNDLFVEISALQEAKIEQTPDLCCGVYPIEETKEPTMREELIKYHKWYEGKSFDIPDHDITIQLKVDEYLKSR